VKVRIYCQSFYKIDVWTDFGFSNSDLSLAALLLRELTNIMNFSAVLCSFNHLYTHLKSSEDNWSPIELKIRFQQPHKHGFSPLRLNSWWEKFENSQFFAFRLQLWQTYLLSSYFIQACERKMLFCVTE